MKGYVRLMEDACRWSKQTLCLLDYKMHVPEKQASSDLAPSSSSFEFYGGWCLCRITAICWSIPCPILSDIAMAYVGRINMEILQNVAVCVNSENHQHCLESYPTDLLVTV